MLIFSAAELVPPHEVTHPEKVAKLAASMQAFGWLGDPLIAYRWNGTVQLLSGTHRRAAAKSIRMTIPVLLYGYNEVYKAWGNTDLWKELMNGLNLRKAQDRDGKELYSR